MARKTNRRTVYRDKKTGHFVKKSTWQRSQSLGGTRYVRQRIKARPRKKKARKPQMYEWLASLTYKTGRNFGIIVRSTNEDGARQEALDFLSRDYRGQSIVENLDSWELTVARGKAVKTYREPKFQTKFNFDAE